MALRRLAGVSLCAGLIVFRLQRWSAYAGTGILEALLGFFA
jgi:hypothetical protein